MMDSNPKWNKHTHEASKKLSRGIFMTQEYCAHLQAWHMASLLVIWVKHLHILQPWIQSPSSWESLYISHSLCVTHILVHSSKTSSKTQNEFVDIISSLLSFQHASFSNFFSNRGFCTYLKYQARSSCNCSSRNWGEFNSHCRGARMQRSWII